MTDKVLHVWVTNNLRDPDDAHRVSISEDLFVSDLVAKCSELFLFDGVAVRAGALRIQLNGQSISNRTLVGDIQNYNCENDVLTVTKRQSGTPMTTPTSATLARRSSVPGSPRMRMPRRKSTPSDFNTDDESPLVLLRKGASLKHLPEWARNAEDIVIEAVRQNGESLLYASEILRGDKRVVLAAVKNDGMSLRFASNDLKDDVDVVTAAVTTYGGALAFASTRLRHDETVINKAIETDPSCIRFALNITCQKEMEVKSIVESVQKDGMSLQLLPKEFHDNVDVVLRAVEQNGDSLQFASDGIKNNMEVVLAAVTNTPSAAAFASDVLREHPLVLLAKGDKQCGSWVRKFHQFYTLHSTDTIRTLPHILPRYRGNEHNLWNTLLLRHGLNESNWSTPINTLNRDTVLAAVTVGLVNAITSVVTNTYRMRTESVSSNQRVTGRSESVGSHQRMMTTDASLLLASSPSDHLDVSGGSYTPEIQSNTVEAKRILREAEQSTVKTAASMRRLLKSTIGAGTAVLSNSNSNLSHPTPPQIHSVDSDGITSSITDETNDKTIITHGGSFTDPQDGLSVSDSCRKALGLANSLTLSEQSPGSPTGLKATVPEGHSGDTGATNTVASTAIEEAVNLVRAHERANQEMDNSLTDSPLTDIEVGMTTIDRKRQLHALTDGEVSSADDIKRMLLGMGTVAMTDNKNRTLSPRIDLCARPLTPREHAEETVERKKRRESKVLNSSIIAEIEEANAENAKRQLSNLASSDVKSTSSIKKLLQSAGAVAMTDSDMRELSPRLSESYDLTHPPPLPHHERRRSSVPSSKMEKSIVIEDSPAGSFHIDIISCSTANHSEAEGSSPRSAAACVPPPVKIDSVAQIKQSSTSPSDGHGHSSDESSRPSGCTTPVIPQLDLFGIAATNANSKCNVIERKLKKEQRERRRMFGNRKSTQNSLNDLKEGKEYDDIETSSEEDNHLTNKGLESTQPVSDYSGELGATYSHTTNSTNLLAISSSYNDERRKTEPQIITEPVMKAIEKSVEKGPPKTTIPPVVNTNNISNGNGNMIDGVRCESSTASYESPTSVQSGRIESASPLDHSTSSVQAASAPSPHAAPHTVDVPVIVEPPKKTTAEMQNSTDENRKLLQEMMAGQNAAPVPPLVQKRSKGNLNGGKAPIPRSPSNRRPPAEKPASDCEEPSLEEIERILPPEILRALNREGTLGTHRCSVKNRSRPSPIATPTNSNKSSRSIEGVRDMLKGMS
eukprot:TRINITY_DN11378_c0_g3_i1.p1 TRINITY_DN11378_c0_g3~~TRINITY_DN11378_c0_g3_i1.p1  ORF type:complete len:1245 (+),score=243.82 TRINITY_DN11378_c0_g3_i1:47-3781(+)